MLQLKVQQLRLSFKQAQAIMKIEKHSTSGKMMYLMLSTKAKTMLYTLLRQIYCRLFSMKKNCRCATLSVFDYIVLLTKNSAAGRTAHFPAMWRSISFPEVFIQSETGKS